MEVFKQEMELFLLLPELQSKYFFYNMFLTLTNESKTGFETGNGIIQTGHRKSIPLPGLWSKRFFHKLFLIFNKELKIDF